MKKKYLKIVATILAVCVAMSAVLIGAVYANAQAFESGVSIDFKNADNDWITLDGTTITDSNLSVMVYNFSDSDIILCGIESNGININFDGWNQGMKLGSSGIERFGISGTTTNNAVFSVTITYYSEGNEIATAETCTAYIYASSSQTYTSATDNARIDAGFGVFGLNTNTTIAPVSTVSFNNTTVTRNVALFVYATCHDPSTTVSVYVDGSKYKTWADFNLHLEFYNDGEQRDHAFLDRITITQTSDTGSLSICDVGTDPENKTVTSQFNENKDNPDGFFLQAGKNASVPAPFSGKIPSESLSTYTINLRQFGQTGGVFGIASMKSVEINSKWTIVVHNNNKSMLREKLNTYSAKGLNKNSYKSGWDAYEKALKNAYVVLGTIRNTAEDVQNAMDLLDTAYANLVRYAVVYTNHYYYQGKDNSNPIKIGEKIDMAVTNNAVYSPEVLSESETSTYNFNRSLLTKRKKIAVGEQTNFTDIIDQYYWYVDTSALEEELDIFNQTIHLDADGNDIYSIDSWTRYASAAANAQRVLNNSQAFQTDIDDAFRAIRQARLALVKLDPDIEWLSEGMGWASNIIDNTFDDDYGYDWDTRKLFASAYSQRKYTALVYAYNNAVQVTNDPNYTKADADRACTALWQAIDDLCVRDESTKGLLYEESTYHADVDHYGYYKNAEDFVSESNGLRVVFNDILNKNTGVYRLTESDFTAESWARLQDAMYGDFAEGNWTCARTEEPYPTYDGEGELDVAAYSMIHNIWFLSTQAEYNACRDNLIAKVNELEWIVDTFALEQKVAEASSYLAEDYVRAGFEVMSESLARANEMLEQLQTPQLYGDPDALGNEDVDRMIFELDTVIAELQPKPYAVADGECVSVKDAEQNIYYVEQGKTASQILADLTVFNNTDDVLVRLYNSKNKVAALNEYIGTGYKVVISGTDGECFETLTFVLPGDVDGNARINQSDFDLMYRFAFENASLDGVFFQAADLNKDDTVDLVDAIILQEQKL